MLKKILLALIFVITAITNVAHAEDDMKTVASKAYVDTQIETKQLKIPAAGQPNVGAGETVMTYTATGNGQIGERALYSDISSYNASTDGDKLITASALNATFTNLPTTPTTKLECANESDGCTLWTIVDQTAYRKPSKNLFDKSNIEANFVYGYIKDNSGVEIVDNVSTYSSYFIKVTPSTSYVVNWVGGSGVIQRIYCYTDDKQWIGRVPNSSPIGNPPYIVTTLANCEYIQFQKQNAPYLDATNIQFEQGSTATPYEPYY